MPVVIPLTLVSHHRKIANAYKQCLRLAQGKYFKMEEVRYNSALIRAEFDVIYNEKDMRISKQMLLDKLVQMRSDYPMGRINFADSPEGVAYQRVVKIPDDVLDTWHPLEKAIYPEYFAKRELRKQQYIEMWDKIHGPPPPPDDSNIEEDHYYF